MDNSRKRDKQGTWIAFVLGLVLSGLGVIIMQQREVIQANKGGFPLEVEDVLRYTKFASIGAFFNFIIMLCLAVV